MPGKREKQSDSDQRDAATDGENLEHAGSAKRPLKQRAIVALIALGVVAVLVLLAGAVVPRWWSTRIANVVDERITVGTFLGLAVGTAFTLLPILVLWLGWRIRSSLRRWLLVVAVAIIVAGPNLATLGIWTGTGSGAEAARRKLDQDAPGFQGGTMFGVILGAVLGLTIIYLALSRRRNKRKARELKAEMKANED